MSDTKFDIVVIGSGPGGYVAAIRAAQLGFKVACIEKEKTLGGTCLNVGCIPSKSLLHSSESYSWLKHEAEQNGILCQKPSFDFDKMQSNKEEVVKGLTQGVASLFKHNNITAIQGKAKFVSTHMLEVTSKDGKSIIEATNFILATGSEPIPLPFLPFDEKTIVSSTGALALKNVPKKLLVIGGGVIGVELASVYNRLGSEVTIIEMLDQICAGMDDAISKGLLQSLKKQGITFHLKSKATEAKVKKEKIQLKVLIEDKSQTVEGNVVLVAVGRRPYSFGLGLEEINVKLEKGVVVVDNNFRTTQKHIFAIGDLIDGPMLAHKASEEGYAVAEIIAGKNTAVNYLAIPNIIYTHPEGASIGLTEKEARSKNLDIVVGNVSFRGNSRARCNLDTEGFVKVIGAGPKRHLVGMHIMGAQASELINSAVVAIEKQTTLHEIATSLIGHPTLSESIKEACGAALKCAVHSL